MDLGRENSLLLQEKNIFLELEKVQVLLDLQ